MNMGQLSSRSIRTFVLRQGRLTEGQQRHLDLHWPHFGIEPGPPEPKTGPKTEPKRSDNLCKTDIGRYFERRAPIWLEVGIGNGTALTQMAAASPDINFLGVEVHLPGVGHALGEIARLELTNVRLIRYDALDLFEHFFEPGSLDRVLIFFPDPWHKTRHRKRRMVNHTFFELLSPSLSDSGLVHFATDWMPYAEQVRNVVQQDSGFACVNDETLLQEITGLRPQTHFERRGLRLGHNVADIVIEKI